MTKVLITGGSGLVGRRLTEMLLQQGYNVAHLSRTPGNMPGVEVFTWDVNQGSIDEEAVQQADHIIHLAGAGIADQRWTPGRKQEILDSRVKSAELLVNALKKTGHRPTSFISSSAVGYYGNRAHHFLHEDDAPGNGFLSEVCVAWEKAVQPVAELGIRLVVMRTGIVLSARGGALAEMEKPVNFHLGTYLGSGNQFYAWIHIDDLCSMFIKAITDPSMQGPYNAVSPNPQRNKVMTSAIAKAKNTAALMLPAPEFALRLVLGEMADTVLDSTRASADKILEAGFNFQFPELDEALADIYTRGI